MKRDRTRTLIFTGLLITIGIVLSQFLSISIPPGQPLIRIGIGYVPLMLISLLFGPYIGLVSGLVGDVLGLLFAGQIHLFHPGFVLNALIIGFFPGFIYRYLKLKDKTFKIINLLITSIMFIVALLFLINISWITENSYIIEEFGIIGSGLAYALVGSSLFAVILMFMFILLIKTELFNHQIIFTVTFLLFVTSVVLTPIWLMQFTTFPYLLQLPLRLVKLPFEAILYILILTRIFTFFKRLNVKDRGL
jgi:ECF transporter S component (folate family)